MDDCNNSLAGKTGPARRDLLRAGSLIWAPAMASAGGWQMADSQAPHNQPIKRTKAGLVLSLEGRRYLECAGLSKAGIAGLAEQAIYDTE